MVGRWAEQNQPLFTRAEDAWEGAGVITSRKMYRQDWRGFGVLCLSVEGVRLTIDFINSNESIYSHSYGYQRVTRCTCVRVHEASFTRPKYQTLVTVIWWRFELKSPSNWSYNHPI